MQTVLDISSIAPDYDTEIQKNLQIADIPGCFGNMILPALDNIVHAELEEYLTPRAHVADEDIYTTNTRGLLPQNGHDKDIIDNFVMTKKSAADISQHKQERIDLYTKQAIACSCCKHTDVCHKLSQNYLQYATYNKMKG